MAAEGLRPLVNPTTPAPLAQLVTDCWHRDPAQRPSAQQLLDRLLEMPSVLNDEPVLYPANDAGLAGSDDYLQVAPKMGPDGEVAGRTGAEGTRDGREFGRGPNGDVAKGEVAEDLTGDAPASGARGGERADMQEGEGGGESTGGTWPAPGWVDQGGEITCSVQVGGRCREGCLRLWRQRIGLAMTAAAVVQSISTGPPPSMRALQLPACQRRSGQQSSCYLVTSHASLIIRCWAVVVLITRSA